MRVIDLDYIKLHGRYDTEITEEDDLLTSFGETAEEAVQRYLNRTWDDVFEEFGYMPEAIKNACCMVVNSLYKNREMDAQQATTNKAFALLLRQYKRVAL